MKYFNTTGPCIPEKHYMVPIDRKLTEIKVMVDRGDYFVLSKPHQYGKTTTLRLLEEYLQEEYIMISTDFQKMSNDKFEIEYVFATTFVEHLYKAITDNKNSMEGIDTAVLEVLHESAEQKDTFALPELFDSITELCGMAKKPIVLMIDNADNSLNNQVFFDFLAQLRYGFLHKEKEPTFYSVILAAVQDIQNLEPHFFLAESHKVNGPWNIAKPFLVDMSFSIKEISEMLKEYESDHQTGMDIEDMAERIYDYTSGYPFLVSLICETIDVNHVAWSKEGFKKAVNEIDNKLPSLLIFQR